MISEEEVVSYFDTLSNWGRWGADDKRGTLNLVTPESVVAAANLVRRGIPVSCGRPLAPRPTARPGTEFLHNMQASGETAPERGSASASDWFAIGFHGFEHTHLDSHSHVFWNQKMYNNRAASLCTTERGALEGGIEGVFSGFFGRGIFIDVPQLKGKDWLEPSEAITPNDLDEWMSMVSIGSKPGDLLWVRTGRGAWEKAGVAYNLREEMPGLSPACLPWLREHNISVLLSDVANDMWPSPYESLGWPIHLVGIVAMGLWLVDNAALETLAETCRREARYEFLSTIVPLTIRRATGSPVNPIAVF